MTALSDFSAAALDTCQRITFGRESAFVALGRTLDARRRDLFAVTYASMRVPDDFVDEVFLKSTARGMPIPAEFVDAWLDRYLDALMDATASPMARHPLIVMTRAIFSQLQLGNRPWQLLIRALHRDVARRPPADRDEFAAYCEGACVAPAVVFLAILEHGRPGRSGRSFESIAPDVRALALFCYLVHLARDLDADLAVDRQLSCVPLDLLPDPGRGRVPTPAERTQARARLLAEAFELEAELLTRLEAYDATGPPPAAAVLRQTHRTYRSVAQQLLAAATADSD